MTAARKRPYVAQNGALNGHKAFSGVTLPFWQRRTVWASVALTRPFDILSKDFTHGPRR